MSPKDSEERKRKKVSGKLRSKERKEEAERMRKRGELRARGDHESGSSPESSAGPPPLPLGGARGRCGN